MITGVESMRELLLDAAGWRTADDIYDAFFQAVGAPVWHGRNYNALWDSIGAGQINEIEVPYCLVLSNYEKVDPAVRGAARDFIQLVEEMAEKGIPVRIRVEAGPTRV